MRLHYRDKICGEQHNDSDPSNGNKTHSGQSDCVHILTILFDNIAAKPITDRTDQHKKSIEINVEMHLRRIENDQRKCTDQADSDAGDLFSQNRKRKKENAHDQRKNGCHAIQNAGNRTFEPCFGDRIHESRNSAASDPDHDDVFHFMPGYPLIKNDHDWYKSKHGYGNA